MENPPDRFSIGTPEPNPSLSDMLGANNARIPLHRSLELRQTLSHSTDSVLAVAASMLFICGRRDSKGSHEHVLDELTFTKVWDVQNHRLKYVLRTSPHVGDVLSLSYLPSFNTIFLGCQDTSIQVNQLFAVFYSQWFSLEHPSLDRVVSPIITKASITLGKEEVLGLPPTKPFFPPVVVRKEFAEFEHRIPQRWVEPSAHLGYVYSLLIGPILENLDAQYLFSGSGDGTIKIWRIAVRELGEVLSVALVHVRTLDGSTTDSIYCMALRDGLLYAGLQGGYVGVFDLETFQRIRTLLGHQMMFLRWHRIRMGFILPTKWNRSFDCVGTISGHDGLVLSMAIEGSALISGGSDNCVRLWWLTSDVNLQTLNFPTFPKNDSGVEELLHVLEKWVRIPTISGQLQHLEDCRLGAKLLKNLLVQLGAEARLVHGAEGRNPLVHGVFRASCARARHILFYGHYDVVSANPKEWATDPFQLVGKDGYLYGRGVTDNKGPILAAVFAASELRREKKLGVDITFLIEGEEESGSIGFFSAVEALRPQLGAVDLILLSNSYWLDDEIPCITYGLRGVIHTSIRVANHHPDSHSGVYGGGIDEPLVDLTHLLAKLISEHKRVLIPGFYRQVRPISPDEEAEFEAIASAVSHNSQVAPAKLKSQWREPTLTIHKIATSGPNDQTTVIPSWARADFSMRIVPDQSLEEIVDAYKAYVYGCFKELASENEVEVFIRQTAGWWLGNPRNQYYSLLKGVIEKMWGSPPISIREGGSIPAVPWLEKEFGAPVIHLPMGQSSDQAHLPNERLRVRNLQ
ncbi:hypothetical protein L0F63_003935, partial [Massospora cicadina]